MKTTMTFAPDELTDLQDCLDEAVESLEDFIRDPVVNADDAEVEEDDLHPGRTRHVCDCAYSDAAEVAPPKTLLTDDARAALKGAIAGEMRSNMFGDGFEDDYIMGGFPAHAGLNNMSDEELLAELGHFTDEDQTPEQRAAAWMTEMGED